MQPLHIEIKNNHQDAVETDSALRTLWRELSRADGINVSAAASPAPANAKSATAGALSALAVTLLGSGGVAIALINVLKDWLRRHDAFAIKVVCNGQTIEISGTSPENIGRLLSQIQQHLGTGVSSV